MSAEPEILTTRTTFMIKGPHIGAFFLNSYEDRHYIWTFDPRLSPVMHWFKYTSRDLALDRFTELVNISLANGWAISSTRPANNAKLS